MNGQAATATAQLFLAGAVLLSAVSQLAAVLSLRRALKVPCRCCVMLGQHIDSIERHGE